MAGGSYLIGLHMSRLCFLSISAVGQLGREVHHTYVETHFYVRQTCTAAKHHAHHARLTSLGVP